MIKRSCLLGGAMALVALGAQADCDAPGAAPGVPDGAIAPEEELAEASAEVRGFVAKTQDYLACLEAQEADLGADISEEERAELVTTYNSAVETMQAVADDFNEQVRRFRERVDEEGQ